MFGCSKCISTKECEECSLPMSLKSGKCVCPSNHSLVGGKCVLCPKGCIDCDSSGKCLKCRDTLRLDNNSNCKCPEGQVLDAGKCTACSSVMEGCSTCSNSLTCELCYDGYGLQENQCAKCGEIVENCISCQPDGQCLLCDSSKHMVVVDGNCAC